VLHEIETAILVITLSRSQSHTFQPEEWIHQEPEKGRHYQIKLFYLSVKSLKNCRALRWKTFRHFLGRVTRQSFRCAWQQFSCLSPHKIYYPRATTSSWRVPLPSSFLSPSLLLHWLWEDSHRTRFVV
jgi:hypothetical protein